MNLTSAAVTALATYRITKLVIEDEITAELREKAYAYLDSHPGQFSEKARYFLSCPWCVSIWAAGGLTLLRLVSPTAADAVGTLLAASAATGIIYERV